MSTEFTEQQDAILDCWKKGLSARTIANRLECSLGTVMRTLAKARTAKDERAARVGAGGFWNAERTEKLLKLWDANASGPEIAEAIGHGVEPSAVRSKLRRMGLVRDLPKPVKRVEKPVFLPVVREIGFDPFAPEHNPKGIKITRLTATTCRWPIGDPLDLESFRYCGAECAVEESYCAQHRQIAYRAREVPQKARPALAEAA